MSEKILERVKKLLDKEKLLRLQADESTDEIQKKSYLHEAEASAARVQKLITEYSLSAADIASAASAERQVGFIQVPGSQGMPKWKEMLLALIVETNNCSGFFSPTFAYICGEKVDAEICRELFAYFSKLLDELGEKEIERISSLRNVRWNSLFGVIGGLDFGAGGSEEYLNSYLIGIVTGLGKRMTAAKREAVIEYQNEHPDSQALVLINKKGDQARALIKQTLNDKDQQPAEFPKATDSRAYQKGIEMSKKLALTTKTIESKGENDADKQ